MEFDGITVTIREYTFMSSRHHPHRIWWHAPECPSGLGFYWPIECFKPLDTDFKFVIGQEYICDERPADISCYGWNNQMTNDRGKALVCLSTRDDGSAMLAPRAGGFQYRYHKSWVRPAKTGLKLPKHKRIYNIFNFWPGASEEV